MGPATRRELNAEMKIRSETQAKIAQEQQIITQVSVTIQENRLNNGLLQNIERLQKCL